MGNVKISEELKATVLSNPNIKEVHFTEDGKYHLNVFDQIAWSAPDAKTGKRAGEKTGKKVPAGSKSVVVETLSRAEILGDSENESRKGSKKGDK